MREPICSTLSRADEIDALLGAIEAVVYSLSPDGQVLHYLSPGADRLIGQAAEDMRRDPSARHRQVLEADQPRLCALPRQLDDAGAADLEYRIRRDDGTVIWVRERCRLQRDAQGRPWRLAGMLSDITLFHRLIDGLRDSESRFRSLVELSSDWYWQQDAEFRFIEFSGAPGGPAGAFVNSQLLGKHRWGGPSFGVSAEQWDLHQAQLERHEPFQNFEYGVVLPNGERIFLSTSGEPVYDQSGVFKGYRGVGHDITQARQMQEALRKSEARLQTVLEATSEGVWDYDLAARETYFSKRFAALLGYGSQEELNKDFHFTEALHPDDREAAAAAQEETLRRGARFDQIYRLRCKDGSYRWFHGRGIAVTDASGAVQRFIGAIADVTVQRAAEMELRRLSVAIEQSPVSILITDTSGRIEYVNPRFCQTTGYSFLDVRGRNPRLLKSGEMPGELYRTLWDTITRGKEWTGELRNRKKSGELHWERVRIFPLFAENGVITHFMALREDITLQKEMSAREALRQEEMLHHARLAAMGEMAAALAHELNQPLSAIANFCGVLEHRLGNTPPDSRAASELVQLINSQALRAGDIVWRIREFSRKQTSLREEVDLNELIREVTRLADIAVKPREVSYAFELASDLPRVSIDRVQVEQVLLNLIRNGVEAMEGVAGERRLVLSTRLADGSEAVQVGVSDSGCGLPDRIAVDLFTPFFTTKSAGMGMGLAISRSIAEAHGGKLWAAPNEGGGTTFYLTLPLGGEA